MNVMNNDGNFRARGGHATEHPGFATVRVDDVGALLFQQARELSQREEIFPRMHRANERRNEGQQSGDSCDATLQRAFRTGRRPRYEAHFGIGFFAQAEHGGDGVFLGAADNESGDDVGDAHGVTGIWLVARREVAAGCL